MYRASLEKGHVIHFNTQDNRRTFVYMFAGELSVNGQRIGQGDQARIDLEQAIHMELSLPAHLRNLSLLIFPLRKQKLRERVECSWKTRFSEINKNAR
ncbi:pirin family protein [Methanosarcina horonobensis]|uniref:pirin family protein n=1 Tax=Methanosarcina horonobensis TaxID=418008 RepID=UPI00373FD264